MMYPSCCAHSDPSNLLSCSHLQCPGPASDTMPTGAGQRGSAAGHPAGGSCLQRPLDTGSGPVPGESLWRMGFTRESLTLTQGQRRRQVLVLDPIMALPTPSAFPCALLGVAGGASSPGTAGPLPLECSSLWHPLSGRPAFPKRLRSPSAAVWRCPACVLPAVGIHPPFPDCGVGRLCNPFAFKMLSESWAEDVFPDCWEQLCSTPWGCLGPWGSSLA